MPSDLGLSTALGWHGENPKELELIDIDPTKIQAETIKGNLSNLAQAQRLASQVNAFSSEELLKSLERMMPGFAGLRDSVTGSIASMARGEIPKDVENQLLRRAAERGITLGSSGSNFSSYDTLRNLGLASLDITRQGIQAATSWIANAPRAPQMNVGSMMFSPQERLSFEFNQAQANLPIRGFNNWVNSLPTNLERGLATAMDYSIGIGTEIGESWVGAFATPSVLGGGAGGGGGKVGSSGIGSTAAPLGSASGPGGLNTSSKLSGALDNYGLGYDNMDYGYSGGGGSLSPPDYRGGGGFL